MKEEELEKRSKAIELAEKVKLLFGFCADLIPDKEMLKETLELAEKRQSMGMGMAPILGAFGQDWEAVENEASLKSERAKALYELIDCLDRIEKKRLEFAEKRLRKQPTPLL